MRPIGVTATEQSHIGVPGAVLKTKNKKNRRCTRTSAERQPAGDCGWELANRRRLSANRRRETESCHRNKGGPFIVGTGISGSHRTALACSVRRIIHPQAKPEDTPDQPNLSGLFYQTHPHDSIKRAIQVGPNVGCVVDHVDGAVEPLHCPQWDGGVVLQHVPPPSPQARTTSNPHPRDPCRQTHPRRRQTHGRCLPRPFARETDVPGHRPPAQPPPPPLCPAADPHAHRCTACAVQGRGRPFGTPPPPPHTLTHRLRGPHTQTHAPACTGTDLSKMPPPFRTHTHTHTHTRPEVEMVRSTTDAGYTLLVLGTRAGHAHSGTVRHTYERVRLPAGVPGPVEGPYELKTCICGRGAWGGEMEGGPCPPNRCVCTTGTVQNKAEVQSKSRRKKLFSDVS